MEQNRGKDCSENLLRKKMVLLGLMREKIGLTQLLLDEENTYQELLYSVFLPVS